MIQRICNHVNVSVKMIVLATVFVGFISSCGYKTDLRPPEPGRVERVSSLNASINCDGIHLEWTPALFDTRANPLNEPASYLVLRKRGDPVEKQSEPDSDDEVTDNGSEDETTGNEENGNRDENTPETLPDVLYQEYNFSLVAIVPGKPVSLTTLDAERETVQWKDTGVPNGPVFSDVSRRFRMPRNFPPEHDNDGNGLIPGYMYSYSVVAVDSNSVTSLPSDLANTPWIVIPGPPQDVDATVNLNRVELTWTAPLHDCQGNPMSSVDRYDIFRSGKNEPEQFVRIGTVQDIDILTETDTTVVMDSVYYYKICAVFEPDVPGEFSDVITVDTANVFPPESPVQLGGAVRPGGVFLNWRYEREADVAGFRIYRRVSNEDIFELLNATVLVSGRMYVDDTVKAGETYTYRITAVDRSVNANESAPGNTWTITVR